MNITPFVVIALCLGGPLIASGQDDADQKPSAGSTTNAAHSIEAFPEQPDDGLLTLNAVILLPDGSPAANAVMEQQEQWLPRRKSIVRADAAGRATFRGVFEIGALIHVRSANSMFQSTLRVDAQSTRIEFAKPIVIHLLPAVTHRVIVESEGHPVSNAHVVATGFLFKVSGETGPDGFADLKLPADDRLRSVDAWDPDRAIGGTDYGSQVIKSDSTRVSLLPAEPFLLRTIDPSGQPIIGIELGLDFGLENGVDVKIRSFPGAHVRTDERGEVNVTWAPQGKLRYVYPTIVGFNWAIQEIDNAQIENRIVTYTFRRQKTIPGRLRMPEGVSARGILVDGNSFGPGSFGTAPSARARADGTFDLHAVSDFGFLIGTVDREWASEPWTGLIMARDNDEPASIEIPVQPATPITIRVTQGPDSRPETNAWIELEDQQRGIQWTNSMGEKKTASGGLRSWLKWNSEGFTVGSVRRGRIKVRAVSGGWDEQKEIKVKSTDPIEVHFHRP